MTSELDSPHRRSGDMWASRMRAVSQFTGAFLPPGLCTFFAIVVAHSVEMSPNHDITASASVSIIAVLAASFGRVMFRDWVTHKEKMHETPPG